MIIYCVMDGLELREYTFFEKPKQSHVTAEYS